jgi:putative membrane protein
LAGKGKLILVIVLAALVLIALIQNRGQAEFSFLFWKMSLSKVILIPVVLLIGFVIGYFAGRRPK